MLVQTWNSLAETRAFFELAARTDFIAGVVGWVDLTDPDVGALLTFVIAYALWDIRAAELLRAAAPTSGSPAPLSAQNSIIRSG